MTKTPCIFCSRSMKRAPKASVPRVELSAPWPAPSARAAVPVFRGRVSPVLDTCTQMLLVETNGNREIKRTPLLVEGNSLLERCRALQKNGVRIVICGAVSDAFFRLLRQANIETICGIAGEFEEVIQAYRCGSLEQPRFKMPGMD